MRINILPIVIFISIFITSNHLFGHGMSDEEKQLILDGGNLKYIYIGMTHMLTGYDHLLFILGVLFYIKGVKEIIKFITAFTIGHSLTLIIATFNSIQINYYLIDAIIALSVCYIAFINLNGFSKFFKLKPPNMLLTVFIFGLIHGLGLSTRLQQLPLNLDQLLLNILSFNIGIEIGQIIALIVMFIVLKSIDKSKFYSRLKFITNVFLFMAGIILCFIQLNDYYKESSSQKITQKEKYKDTIVINLPSNSEIEYKIWVIKGQKFQYSWDSEVKLYFDFHGEPASVTNGYFESFKEGTSSTDTGELKATFVGTHGWYWKNNSLKDTSITLKLNGEYKLTVKK